MKAIQQPEITFDAERHIYRCGLQEYTSVTRILRTCFPVKKSWDGVDPAVIANARERGSEVDQAITQLIRTGTVTLPPNHRKDTEDRFRMFFQWFQQFDDKLTLVDAQVILADHENGIAGQADLVLIDTLGDKPARIWDVKTTAQIEHEYKWQLGGYASMYRKMFNLDCEVGVIHIPKDGLRLKTFDTEDCIRKWGNLVAVWNDTKQYIKADKESEA